MLDKKDAKRDTRSLPQWAVVLGAALFLVAFITGLSAVLRSPTCVAGPAPEMEQDLSRPPRPRGQDDVAETAIFAAIRDRGPDVISGVEAMRDGAELDVLVATDLLPDPKSESPAREVCRAIAGNTYNGARVTRVRVSGADWSILAHMRKSD